MTTTAPITRRSVFDRRLFVALVTAAAVGAVAVVPYQLGLAPNAAAEAGLTITEFVMATIASGLMLAVAGAVTGLTLGRRVGLGAPLLAAAVRGKFDAGSWRRMLPVAICAGLGAAALVVAFDVTFAAHLPVVETGEVSLAIRYLASIYGAVNEELLLRFGLLTLVVWAASKIMRATGEVPNRVLWAGTVIAAVAFGASHLPAVATLVELTPLVVFRTVGLNALLGTVFGWLYWSRGLGAAIVAHLAADLVIQTTAWWIA